MVALSSLTTDPARMATPIWVDVQTADGPFSIQTTGFTGAYRNRLSSMRRERADELNRNLRPGQRSVTADTLPTTDHDRLTGIALSECCIHGVRGLTHGDGREVTVEEFRALLGNPESARALLEFALQAASYAHDQARGEAEAAAGN